MSTQEQNLVGGGGATSTQVREVSKEKSPKAPKSFPG